MGDLRTPRLNMGDQKSPKLPLDLTVIIHVHVHVYIIIIIIILQLTVIQVFNNK